MVQRPKTSLNAWHFTCALLIGALMRTSYGFELDPDLVKGLDVPNSIPVSYRRILSELDSFSALPAATRRFSLSSFTPFCSKFTVPEVAADVVPECIRWEEQELDMLLMYLDLIAVGMDAELATQFYQEIRCLSRANIFPAPQLKAWEVCFSYDYSEMVGNLLAQYVLKDMFLLEQRPLDPIQRQFNTTGRFFSMSSFSASSGNNFLLSLFGDGSNFRLYSTPTQQMLEKSCCEQCTEPNYFVNVQKNECLRDPFGKHCCHLACKSLGRLKVGASSSTNYCCKRCRPLSCKR